VWRIKTAGKDHQKILHLGEKTIEPLVIKREWELLGTGRTKTVFYNHVSSFDDENHALDHYNNISND
jgi:hypothetical protein